MKLIIFSDIDGTFINHDSYSYDSIRNFVIKIKDHHQIIFNSSKTFSEIKKINEDLHLNFPFVVENGACLFFPKNLFNKRFESINFFEHENYFGYPMVSKDKNYWIKKISNLKKKFNFNFDFFNDLQDVQLEKITGLGLDELKDSKNRLFSEPIFWDDSNENLIKFTHQIELIGGQVNIGGRFIHVTDGYDKGSAIKKFLELNEKKNNKDFLTVSIGDSHNDISMLELTDYRCIVKTKKKKKLDLINKKKLYHSTNMAPEGWRESIKYILKKEKLNF